MTAYELIRNVQPALENLKKAGFDVSCMDYMTIYEEYAHRKSKGEKKTFIFSYLSQKYDKSERSIQRIIRKFQRNIELTA